MNKKGQVILFQLAFMNIVLVIVYVFFIAPLLNQQADLAIQAGATGLYAMFWAYSNAIIAFVWLLFNVIAARVGGAI